MANSKKHVVVAAMRNEGAFILEWVSWYKMLGFDDVLILTNDCNDHSVEMLDLLQSKGWVTHLPHIIDPNKAPKHSAHRAARAHPLVVNADWMFLCDVDEFLVFHNGIDTIQEYLGDDEPDVAGIAIHWQSFGTSGHKTWSDGWTHTQFQKAGPMKSPANRFFKSFIYKPHRFKRFGAHSPQGFKGEWGIKPYIWADDTGQKIALFHPNGNAMHMTVLPRISHKNAQLNHYIIRSDESFEFKRGRPSASARKDRYTDNFKKLHNCNDVTDLSALRFTKLLEPIYAEIIAIPGMARLHHLCCADYVATMCEKRGDDPEADQRYRDHLDAAENASIV